MFVNLMRSNQRWLMIIISVLVIISFIWFYSDRTRYDRIVSDKVGTIYGRSLTSTEYERVIRQLQTAEELGLTDVVQPELAGGRDAGEVVANHLVMRHQAEQMGIVPSDDEVKNAEMKLTAFQAPGGAGFDSTKYAQYVTDKLNPRGFSESQLDELVKTNLQFGKLRTMLDATVVLSPSELRGDYDQEYTKTDASVVRFKTADFAAGINPTDDEVKKYYDDQKDKFQASEKRRVQYVVFGLDDAQKKLYGKSRMDALKPQADAAAGLLEKLLDAKGKSDFAAVAKEAGAEVKETPEFEQGQRDFPQASVPGFAAAAFHLTQKDPDSDVPLEVASGRQPEAYYVLHLAGVTPSRQLTLDEAKPKVVAAIKDERARAAVSAKAEEVRTKLVDSLKAGHSFVEAAKEAGVPSEDVPDFSMAEPDYGTTPDASIISETSLELSNGELSKFVATPEGGLLVYVRGRKPVDEAKFNTVKDTLMTNLETQKKRFFFYEWLRASRDAAGVQMAPNLRG